MPYVYDRLRLAFLNEALSRATINNWFNEFKTTTENNISAVRRMIEEDKRKHLRMDWCRQMLDKFNGGDSNAVTSSQVMKAGYCYEPETKTQSAQWVILLHNDNASAHSIMSHPPYNYFEKQ
ncbi:unnamed protein product [Leptidea sinapis]|uniref:Mos1 transposase HTH domain-containing protein n=1 Tax=Leptidea sinapis TaxID=189913 RepID=A0A5E4QG70_9NEOP|nr:unnamed protein product [Leptidea sinapis]